MIALRTVGAGDAEPLRTLRLRALAADPAAFATSAEQESLRPARQWRELAAQDPDGGTVIVAVDEATADWVGLAGGRWFDRDVGIASLWGLWVDPSARGTGTGQGLVGAVIDWARAHDARFLRLGVYADAEPFYASLGFVAVDDPRPMRTDPSRLWTPMARPI